MVTNYKQMKKHTIIATLIFAIALATGCTEYVNQPHGSDGIPPGPVVVDEILNYHGSAVIYFTPPKDVDLLYIKAVFTDDNGNTREVKVSSLMDSLFIQGFGSAKDYNIDVYAVDRGENSSSPNTIVVSPLEAPIKLILPTITGEAGYGGLKITYENSHRAEVSVNLLKYEEDQNRMAYKESHFTSQLSGEYNYRGFKAVMTRFGVYVEDRWGNMSDTVYFEVIPIPDEFLDKELFSVFKLYGDQDFNDYGFGEGQMWDNQWGNQWNCGHSAFVALPHYLTIDLGVNVKLSRFKLYQRGGDELYKHGNPKHFKIYGTLDVNDLPPYNSANPNEGWTLLKECYSFKPSGLPIGQTTAEDHEFQNKGEDFEFDIENLVEVRYIRIENLETWGEQLVTVIGELSFWGEISE